MSEPVTNGIPLAALKTELDTALARIIPDAAQRQAERNLLLRHFLGLSRETAMMDPDRPLTDETALAALKAALAQRLSERVPIQYLLGEASFYGLTFHVASGVLIPRPETELLVDAAKHFCQASGLAQVRALDLGTGSGCIAIALKHVCPGLDVSAVERSPEALVIARENARRLEVNIAFYAGSWFEPLPGPARFEVIVSNPPYIPHAEAGTLTPEVQAEPHAALFAGDDFRPVYAALFAGMQTYLAPGGRYFFEMGIGQSEALQALAAEYGFTAESLPDYAGIPRILTGHAAE